ncbi:uncharacterized protein LOC133927990 [Phragmites australis]|uniref:uncharacterized protein LOC133927990 n=1 Tax=Phragmites australis TaxID=29695 RepID=UPI002D7697C0|nr:uncharacterized protein LOC133927990 [Phragmites australis]
MDSRQAWKEYLRELCFSSHDSSDEEDLFMEGMRAWHADLEESERRPWCGSVPGRKRIIRYQLEGHMRLFNDYFADPPVYPDYIFRRMFRMKRNLFLKIVAAVEEKDPWFQQRRNAAGELGLSALQKVTTAFRMLAYDAPADSLDECLRLGESTIIESMRHFVNAIVQRWKNCPTAWAESYTEHVNAPTIILEAVASHDLWIWHAFFDMSGSLNDINVLHQSHLLDDLAVGEAPKVNYTINGHEYTMGYYLADGIYPEWATFGKPIPSPVGRKRQHFVVQQAVARKDVERAFGVLQSRFPIVRGATRLWDEETLSAIMTACIIMQNMIIEDEREDDDVEYVYEGAGDDVQHSHDVTPPLMVLSQRYNAIRCKQYHVTLREDLVEHLWQLHGGDF